MLDSNTCEARPKTTSEALCDYWHPIARSTEVTDKPVKAKLLDQPLVLWRSNRTRSGFLRPLHSPRHAAFARLDRQR